MTMLTIDEVRARKTRLTAEVRIVLDPDWGTRLSDLEAKATTVVSGSKEATELEEQLEKMRAEADDKVVVFKVRALGGDEFNLLKAAHPSKKGQREGGDRGPGWDERTFPLALVAACSLDPVMTVDDVRSLWADEAWSLPELEALFHTALGCCLWRPQPSFLTALKAL